MCADSTLFQAVLPISLDDAIRRAQAEKAEGRRRDAESHAAELDRQLEYEALRAHARAEGREIAREFVEGARALDIRPETSLYRGSKERQPHAPRSDIYEDVEHWVVRTQKTTVNPDGSLAVSDDLPAFTITAGGDVLASVAHWRFFRHDPDVHNGWQPWPEAWEAEAICLPAQPEQQFKWSWDGQLEALKRSAARFLVDAMGNG